MAAALLQCGRRLPGLRLWWRLSRLRLSRLRCRSGSGRRGCPWHCCVPPQLLRCLRELYLRLLIRGDAAIAQLGPLCAQASAGGDRPTMATPRHRSAGTLGDVAYRGDRATPRYEILRTVRVRIAP